MSVPHAEKRGGAWYVVYSSLAESGHYGPFPGEKQAQTSADRFWVGYTRRLAEWEAIHAKSA